MFIEVDWGVEPSFKLLWIAGLTRTDEAVVLVIMGGGAVAAELLWTEVEGAARAGGTVTASEEAVVVAPKMKTAGKLAVPSADRLFAANAVRTGKVALLTDTLTAELLEVALTETGEIPPVRVEFVPFCAVELDAEVILVPLIVVMPDVLLAELVTALLVPFTVVTFSEVPLTLAERFVVFEGTAMVALEVVVLHFVSLPAFPIVVVKFDVVEFVVMVVIVVLLLLRVPFTLF